MPVEIKELIIRAIVTDSQVTSTNAPRQQIETIDRSALIQECVREVLKRLDKIKER